MQSRSARPLGMAVLILSTSALRDVMKDEMKRFFYGKQGESDHGKNDLKFFGAKLFRGDRLHAPLRGGTLAEAADAPYRVEIDQGAGEGQQHHRNADPVGVKAPGHTSADCRRERRQADHQAETADRNEGRAEVLEQGEGEARPQNQPASEKALRVGGAG
jgi:hypothetical protein